MTADWTPNAIIASGTVAPAWWYVRNGFCPGWYGWHVGRDGREDRNGGYVCDKEGGPDEARRRAVAAAETMAGRQ